MSIFRQRIEQPHIVVAEITRVILGLVQIDAVRLEHGLIGAEVQRLGVGDDAVEIKKHRLQDAHGKTFTGANRQRKAAFARRVRAVEVRVVVAVRVVGFVEIDRVYARRGAIQLEIPARCVCLGAARHVAERHEQAIEASAGLDERAERERLTFERELEDTHALVLPDFALRRGHLDHDAFLRRIQRCGHHVFGVGRKIFEGEEVVDLAGRHRLIRLLAKGLVLRCASHLNLAHVIALVLRRRRIAGVAATERHAGDEQNQNRSQRCH